MISICFQGVRSFVFWIEEGRAVDILAFTIFSGCKLWVDEDGQWRVFNSVLVSLGKARNELCVFDSCG